MSKKNPFSEVVGGFVSLLTGMSITLKQFFKPTVTVQYPHQALKMPARYRGNIILKHHENETQSACIACNLCVKACPTDCIELTGEKREGAKKKSVTMFKLNLNTCSLCGACVEVCPTDALAYSKDYNLASTRKEDFSTIDLFERFQKEFNEKEEAGKQ